MRANKRYNLVKFFETELYEALLCAGIGQKTNFDCICNATRKKNSFVQQPQNVSVYSSPTLRNFSYRGNSVSCVISHLVASVPTPRSCLEIYIVRSMHFR